MEKVKILFICTGNIFRSLTAELAFRKYLQEHLGSNIDFEISSAGTKARPQPIREYVLSEFKHLGLDASAHTPRKLTREMLEQASIVIPMAQSHKDYLLQEFNFEAPMFNELCHDLNRSVPDIDDEPVTKNLVQEACHASLIINYITNSMPELAHRIKRLIPPRLEVAEDLELPRGLAV